MGPRQRLQQGGRKKSLEVAKRSKEDVSPIPCPGRVVREVLSWGVSDFRSQQAGEALQKLGVFLGTVSSVALNLSSNSH